MALPFLVSPIISPIIVKPALPGNLPVCHRSGINGSAPSKYREGCFVLFSSDVWELVFKLVIDKEGSVGVSMKWGSPAWLRVTAVSSSHAACGKQRGVGAYFSSCFHNQAPCCRIMAQALFSAKAFGKTGSQAPHVKVQRPPCSAPEAEARCS